VVAGAPGGGVPTQTNCAPGTKDAGASVLRRLAGLEYQLTLQDLFQLSAPPSLEGIPPDTAKEGFKTFAEVQTVSAQHLRAYLDKATELADALLADTTRRGKVLGCEPSAAGCLRAFLGRFGKLAFRRALDATELETYAKAAETNALDVTDQIRYAIETLLTSPNFLYRVELGSAQEGLSTLTGAEVASRLSFGLWGRAPSAELLDKGAQGALDTPEGLTQTAQSMLTDARTQQFFGAFFRQWLGYEALRAPTTPVPGWSDALMGPLQQETDQLVAEFAWQGKDFFESLTSNHTKITPEVATFYGLPAPAAGGVVEFPAGHVRANTGLLTHASLLSMKSDGDSIAIRGNWLRKTFLCESLEVPAAIAEQLGDLLVGLTRVQIVQKRNTEAACKGCHQVIDPIGIGFAKFDATGRFDSTVDITPYGVTPGLPGAPSPAFSSVAELSAKLKAMPEVAECLSERAFLYIYGRDAATADACTLGHGAEAFEASSHGFTALLKGLIDAPAFRLRRVPTGTP
jgi:hypothetical protein